MRSNSVYTVCILIAMILSLYKGPSRLHNIIILLVISPLTYFILPIGMSKGPLHSRVTRTLLLTAVTMGSEFAAAGTFGLLTGSTTYPTETDSSIVAAFIASYMACILFNLIGQEGVIAFCNRDEEGSETTLRIPLLELIILTHFAGPAVVTRMYNVQNRAVLALICFFVIDLLTLAIALAALDLTQKELRSWRQATVQASLIRQSRHLKSEILSIASSSTATRKLRHDLANQVSVIDELLEEGHVDAAEQYLAELQDRAQSLAEP